MHLQIVSPLAVEAELTGIVSVRAEDRSGSFVILPGHTDFLTVLAVMSYLALVLLVAGLPGSGLDRVQLSGDESRTFYVNTES